MLSQVSSAQNQCVWITVAQFFRSPNLLIIYTAFLMLSHLDTRYKLNILLNTRKKSSVWCILKLNRNGWIFEIPSLGTWVNSCETSSASQPLFPLH